MKNKKKKPFVIAACILGVCIVIFFLMGVIKKSSNPRSMVPPVYVNYPNVSSNLTYEHHLFNADSMHEINIKIDKKDWEDLSKYPLAKRKYVIDIVIDGVTFKNVAFRTKGNSSLKSIANGPDEGPAADRFSFMVEFGKFEKGQTYFGLEKINLNNVFGDASYLNDYLAYDMFHQMNVPAPLASFAYIKINGENFGLYSTVEEVGPAFLKRNNLEGLLYKPEKVHGRDRGASLKYTDNNIDSYPSIFNNAESKITNQDKIRLLQSIQQLNEKQNLEDVLDTDEILRYFAVHNYILSYDSYTGKSIHNYYLLENNGQLSIIPWDYNLSFGRFNMQEDITTIVNYGIDTPTNQAESKNRPMWNWIERNKTYKKKYHTIMQELINTYYESGYYEKEIDSIYEIIKSYQTVDITGFYNQEQFDQAISTLKIFCKYRADSIQLQLDGKLSTETQNQNKEDQINASSINLSDLGFIADDNLKNTNSSKNTQTNNKKEN